MYCRVNVYVGFRGQVWKNAMSESRSQLSISSISWGTRLWTF